MIDIVDTPPTIKNVMYYHTKLDTYISSLLDEERIQLIDILQSYESHSLFNFTITDADLFSDNRETYVSLIRENTLEFIRNYHPSDTPTDEQFVPENRLLTMLYGLLTVYFREILTYLKTISHLPTYTVKLVSSRTYLPSGFSLILAVS